MKSLPKKERKDLFVRLVRRLMDHGIQQQEIAENVGYKSRNTIARFVSTKDDATPLHDKLEALVKFCKKKGVPIDG